LTDAFATVKPSILRHLAIEQDQMEWFTPGLRAFERFER